MSRSEYEANKDLVKSVKVDNQELLNERKPLRADELPVVMADPAKPETWKLI